METPNEVKKRQIIIETDGSNINIVKAEVSGLIEFSAILNMILGFINKTGQEAPKATKPEQTDTPVAEPVASVVEAAK